MKKILLLSALFLLATAGTSTLQAQTRHAYLEEFTGSWCGFCVRGAYAIQQLETQFPGQVVSVCIHCAGAPTEPDPMETAQGDSINQGIGFPVSDPYGFPDGWTARMVEPAHGDWNVDPSQWADNVPEEFGLSAATYPSVGIDSIITLPATVQCTVDNVSFNANTQTVTARVTGTFSSVMSGDFRLNIMVTEDSVSGPAGGEYDQHNYYSSQDASVGGALPSNPMYGQPYDITGWQHMHVFRSAVGGIYGQKGVIPATTTAGGKYSATFTFPIPSNVLNPNQVHLVGIVNQYSETVAADNEVFDAMEVPLSSSPIAFSPNNVSVSGDNGLSTWAHAGGDTTLPLTVQNGGNNSVTVTLQMDPSTPLPAGWFANFSPSPFTLAAGASKSVTMTISAPEQSNYIAPNVVVLVQQEGVYIPTGAFSFTALSDNTAYAIYSSFAGIESASVYGMPDTMLLHSVIMPWDNQDILNNFDPSQPGSPIRLAVFSTFPWLDGAEAENGSISPLPTILNLLGENIPVYISSDDALAWAYGGNANTETDAVQGFFNDSLGINYKEDLSRVNSSNQYVSFRIDGTSDPIGKGMTNLTANAAGALAPAGETPLFTLATGSPSTTLFYTDDTKSNNAALKCQSPSGWRAIYTNFTMDNLVDQTDADTIFRRSIEWLLSGAAAAVNTPVVTSAPGITASPNPFHGTTQINYVASQDEQNVTFAAYDVLGREVATLPSQKSGSSYVATFDGSVLADGTYVIVAHSSKGTSEVRVVNQQ